MATRDSLGATPRLRFDRVALRLVQGVRGALEGVVPDSLCVVFAVTAPIREPSKTMTALIETIRARFSLGAVLGEHAEALYGNEVLHNPDPPPNALLDMAQSLLECAEAPDEARSYGTAPSLATLRRVCEQVLDADGCAKVVAAVGQQRARPTRN